MTTGYSIMFQASNYIFIQKNAYFATSEENYSEKVSGYIILNSWHSHRFYSICQKIKLINNY